MTEPVNDPTNVVSMELAELVEKYKPLRERVFDLIKDQPTFSVKTAHALFPDETEKSIYRVFKELEREKRIRFLTFVNRAKIYTALGQSELPMLQGFDNATFPCSQVLKNIESFYSPNGMWNRLEEINRIPITISLLFIAAQNDDHKAMKESWIKLHGDLVTQRQTLRVVAGYIESILKHPSMNGDLDRFKTVFNGDDEHIPSPEQMTAFKVWYRKYLEGKA